jgi:hypothetical protein
MFVQATRFKRELRSLKRMSRSELLEAIGEQADCLPHELQRRGGDETMVRLRLILFAARLIQALERMPSCARRGRSPAADQRADRGR